MHIFFMLNAQSDTGSWDGECNDMSGRRTVQCSTPCKTFQATLQEQQEEEQEEGAMQLPS